MDSRFTVTRMTLRKRLQEPPTCLTTNVLGTLNVPSFLIDTRFDEVSKNGSKNGSKNVIISGYGKYGVHYLQF